MKNLVKIIFTITGLIFITGCTNVQSLRIGYMNLTKVYETLPELYKADSIRKIQMQKLEKYIAGAEEKIKKLEVDEITAALYVKAYNDTINLFKSQVDQIYNNDILTANNRIQAVIDSIGSLYNLDYILSTINNNILFVKDTTNDITFDVIKALKTGDNN